MKCSVLSGFVRSQDPIDGEHTYFSEVAFIASPSPEEIIQGTLEILKRVYWEARNMQDSLLNAEVEWEMTEGRIWDYLPQEPPSFPTAEIIPQHRRPQSSRDNSFAAGVVGFLIGTGV